MSEGIQYIAGQHLVCPVCKMKTVVKIKHELKDFKVVESYPICAFCKARLDTCKDAAVKVDDKASARKALSEIFGEDEDDQRQQKTQDMLKESLLKTESHFCRDCRHYIHHPFLSRCELHHRSVEPMDDCKQFSPLTHGDEG